MTRHEHLYLKLMEECAEVQQRVSKLLQFGMDEMEPGQTLTNSDRLRAELNDLLAIIDMLEQDGFPFVDPNELGDHFIEKRKKVNKYLKYSQQLGRVIEDGKEPRK